MMNSEAMNSTLDVQPRALVPVTTPPSDAEDRLEMNREALRLRLEEADEDTVTRIARLAGPLARETVREHPYTSLAAAALVGVWLVRRKPWQALGGSVLAGLLARQALSLSLSSGSKWLNRLSASRGKPGTGAGA
jgi:ElaB/YqjD/DUF883 family membrane-anchored ribosome-binding protein